MNQDNIIYDDYNNPVILYGRNDFEKMRKSGRLASQVLDYITPFVKEGVSTLQLDKLCHNYIVSKGAIPAPLNIKDFLNQFALQ